MQAWRNPKKNPAKHWLEVRCSEAGPVALRGGGDIAQDLAHEVDVMEVVLFTKHLLPAGPFLWADQARLDVREPLRFGNRPVGAGGVFSHAGSGARGGRRSVRKIVQRSAV